MVPLADDGLSVDRRDEEGLRRVAVPGRLGGGGLRPGRAEDPEARRLLLHGAGRGRHGRPADEPHGRSPRDRRSIEGPWENSPYNPIIRTRSADERWWSKGHATLVEGPDGKWYAVYHAYENGFYNLGRQTLLEPIEWTADGWFKAAGADVGEAHPEAGRRGRARTASRSRTTSRRTRWACSGASTAATATDKERYPLRARRARAEGEGHDARATARRCGSSAATTRTRCRWRSTSTRRDGRPAGLLQQPAVRGARLLGHELRDAPLRHRAPERQARAASAARCTCASPTTATSSRSTTAPTERRGSASARAWRCRATTTTWRTTSSACARRSTRPGPERCGSAGSRTARCRSTGFTRGLQRPDWPQERVVKPPLGGGRQSSWAPEDGRETS